MERAGDLLKDAFAPPDSSPGGRYLPLFRNWRTIVGRELERRVTLLDIRNDALIAETTHPGWRQAVLLRKEEILKRTNNLYPGLNIKEIRVQIVKKIKKRIGGQDNTQIHVLPDAGREESKTETDKLEALFAGMTDNELKQAVKKLFAGRPRGRFEGRPPGQGD